MVTAIIGVLPTDRDAGLGISIVNFVFKMVNAYKNCCKFEKSAESKKVTEEGDKIDRERKMEMERASDKTL